MSEVNTPEVAGTAVSRVWGSREVRDDLSGLLRRDLLGPWDGEDEVITGKVGPRDRYITGLLAPLDAGSENGQQPDDEDLDAGEFGDEAEDKPVAGVSSLTMFPSSMGVTFTVAAGVDEVRVAASWGRYVKRSDASEVDVLVEEGKPLGEEETLDAEAVHDLALNDESPRSRGRAKPWQRVGLRGEVVIDLFAADVASGGRWRDEKRVAPEGAPNVWVRWVVRVQADGRRVVTVFLVNRQTVGEFGKAAGVDAAWVYQAHLEVTAVDGTTPVFVGSGGPSGLVAAGEDPEQELLSMLYRNYPEYAAGHGVAVGWDEAEPDDSGQRRAWRIYTDALPSYDVPQTAAPTVDQVPGFTELVLDMKELAQAPDGPSAALMLRPLVDAYRDWIGKQKARIGVEPGLADHVLVAEEALRKAATAADRVEAGLQVLADDPRAWQAFRFMNEAMALQRQHTDAMNACQDDPALSFAKALTNADVPARRSWRPFQIAFVLLNLPALSDPLNPERTAGGTGQPPVDSALADLLFFPTGGGKTEAYLGLTAFTFAIRRLQGTVGGLDGSRGVGVLMRYTLRLLTSQQLQRAATLVAAAEILRRRAMASGVNPWGGEAFRIGLWVGGAVTPNRFEDAEAFVQETHGWGRASGRSAVSPVPFTECPWCGTKIETKTDVVADKATRRVRIYCGDTTGRCEFTQAKNLDGLPVLTVDEEIYRYPPSLLIATVDKFAQLPRNGAAGHLFGHVTTECGRHGFKHADIRKEVCGADKHNAQERLPAAATTVASRLRPLDLIIQDELHLISDALGTMVGLYETAIDELATWEVDGRRVRPKVVASTATVRRAEEQAYALFRRRLAIFPPPGLDVEDSFFARQVPVDEDHPGRRYLGVCAQGIRLKSAEIRVTSAVMSFAQMLFDDHGAAADPYMTLVGYFNSLRELGGMRRLVEDDVTARLSRPLHKDVPGRVGPMPRRRRPFMEELTSRVNSGSIKRTLKAIGVPFNPDEDTTQARQAAAVAAKNPRGRQRGRAAGRPSPAPDQDVAKDVVLATNMFGVGVDIPRLGLMTVTGQPKATSEYIQATSRVGRDPKRPGLVVTIYNWARPRDLSHYERFGHYHATFYQQVEALSVTPFSLPAMDRAITGAFLGALRHLDPTFTPDTGLNAVAAGDSVVEQVLALFADRAASITVLEETRSEVEFLLRKRLQQLQSRRDAAGGQTVLAYRGGKQGQVGMLRDPESGIGWDAWTVPNSLRETEPEINLQLLPYDPTVENPNSPIPQWTSAATQTSDGEGGDDV